MPTYQPIVYKVIYNKENNIGAQYKDDPPEHAFFCSLQARMSALV